MPARVAGIFLRGRTDRNFGKHLRLKRERLAERPRRPRYRGLMKVQRLISAGFAITALAAASIPAIGWTLLGDGIVEQPTVSVHPWSDAPPLLVARSASIVPVAFERKPAGRDGRDNL